MWRGSSLLCYDPSLLSKFSCCLLTVMSSVDDMWVPTALHRHLLTSWRSTSELEQGSKYFTYQKVQDQKATQQVSQLTWWSQTFKVLKRCQHQFPVHPPFFFQPQNWFHLSGIILSVPSLVCRKLLPFRITVADLEDSLDYYMPYTSRKERKLIFKCLE